MYIPDKAKTLDTKTDLQLRIALQGYGGTGKTTSALTFPNPVVLDIDNSADKHNTQAVGIDTKNVHVLPFYDQSFLDEIKPRGNLRDVFRTWIEKHASLFAPEQTLVLDSWTFLQDAFDKQTDLEPVYTKKGEIDEFAFWARKQDYARDILNALQRVKCNVIVIFHETVERDNNGRLTGKVTPLMQGRFADKLLNYFTYWFRQIAMEKSIEEKLAKDMQITVEALKRICDFSTNNSMYTWQTQTTTIANCKSKIPFQRFVPAHYKIFQEPEQYSI